jgi:hypothetical protein
MQMPRTKVYLCVFNALNRMVSMSPVIAKSLTSLPHLIEKLISQLAMVDSQLSSGLLLTKGTSGGHNKNSESARSMNEIGQETGIGEAAGGSGQQTNMGGEG